MDRENRGYRSVYNSYVIDDGWRVPETIVEVINLRIQMAWEDAYRIVCKQKLNHKGDWISLKTAYEYEARAWIYRIFYGNQYIGELRKIGQELQEKYGVTELEAINILNGYHIKDYVDKYYRMENLIPIQVNVQKICNEVLDEYGYEAYVA